MSKLRPLVVTVAALFAFAATAFAGPSKVAWSKCYPGFGPSFECGTVQVPPFVFFREP